MYTWTLLRAGTLRLDGGGMFGVVPRTLWSRMVAPDDQNRIPLQTNCVLLRGEAGTVLVETGFGGKWSDKERGFYDLERRTVVDALAEVDVAPDMIDHVVLSHLHFDHAAGLTHVEGDEAVATFPNATVHAQRQEWDDARSNKSTMSRTYLDTHLAPVADSVALVNGNAEILPGIRVMPLPGHTWGQQGICFDDEAGTLCFPGDVVPTRNHAGLRINMGYDVMPYVNMETKTALFTQACDEGWRLILDHEPGEAVVRVERDGDRSGRFDFVACSTNIM